MRYKLLALLLFMLWLSAGRSYAVDDQVPSTQPAPTSLGEQAGDAARELKDKVDESLSVGVVKVAESSKKVKIEAQETVKTLQEQWDAFAKQLQEKTQEIQKQVQQQWQDFNKSFNKTPKS